MKESNILKQITLYVSERGYIPLRLNSGKFYQGTLRNTPEYGEILTQLRHVMGTVEGTADLLVILDGGRVLWIETKTRTGRQREAQKRFQAEVERRGHNYVLAREIKDLEKYI